MTQSAPPADLSKSWVPRGSIDPILAAIHNETAQRKSYVLCGGMLRFTLNEDKSYDIEWVVETDRELLGRVDASCSSDSILALLEARKIHVCNDMPVLRDGIPGSMETDTPPNQRVITPVVF